MPGQSGTAKPYCFGERRGVLGVDRFAAGKGRRIGAHLRAALHAGMAADRHQSAFVAPDIAFEQAEIQNIETASPP